MFFNALSDAIDRAVPSRQKPKPKPAPAPAAPAAKRDFGPSKDPAVRAAADAARKRSEMFLKKK